MIQRGQFTIRYAMLETFWIALATGVVRFLALNWQPEGEMSAWFSWGLLLSFVAAPALIATAVGGLFGYMRLGFIVAGWTVPALLLLVLFLPAAMGAAERS